MNDKPRPTKAPKRCSRCHDTNTTLGAYGTRNMWGDLSWRWLCAMCAMSRGFVVTQYNA